MSKRSTFDKISKDFYPTIDPNAIPTKLVEFIRGKTYAEPCCGEGDLVDLLTDVSLCRWESDIDPKRRHTAWDALRLTNHQLEKCELIITNPPFSKTLLLPMIDVFTKLKPTWLLLPADLMHNQYFAPHMSVCSKVVSVGRLFWFKNKWVEKRPFEFDELERKWDNQVVYYDAVRGTKYYTGYITSNGKPCKSETVSGTDNYCWYYWEKDPQPTDTIFYGRS